MCNYRAFPLSTTLTLLQVSIHVSLATTASCSATCSSEFRWTPKPSTQRFNRSGGWGIFISQRKLDMGFQRAAEEESVGPRRPLQPLSHLEWANAGYGSPSTLNLNCCKPVRWVKLFRWKLFGLVIWPKFKSTCLNIDKLPFVG